MAGVFDHSHYTMYSISMNTASQTVGCVKAATEILGDKWTPQLLRFFINEEVVRFCQLHPRTLSARLITLEEHDIIEKLPSESTRCEYRLTDKGRDLLPILQDMEQWSDKYATSHV